MICSVSTNQENDVPVPSSSIPPDGFEQISRFITNIRAEDVAVGLRRMPAGFYIVVQHSGREWRTENKPVSANDGVAEWGGPIPIPPGLTATVCLCIYASFELQPMLGDGEQLRKVSVTVKQLLNRSESKLPFTFFPKNGEVVSPCSSISLTLTRGVCDANASSTSRILEPHHPKQPIQLYEATNQGHGALSRFRKVGDKRDLERSVAHFEHALRVCPLDHPCRAAAQSNLAMATFIRCRVVETSPSFGVPLSLYRNVLAARPIGHLDRHSTLVSLACVHFARFEKRRSASDAAQLEALLYEAMDLSPAESDRELAALLLHHLQAVGPVQESAGSFVEWDSDLGLTGEDWSTASVQLIQRFEQSGNLADLQHAISLLEATIRSTSALGWDERYLIALINLGAALAHRFERLGNLRDLEHSVSKYKEAVDLTFDSHPRKPTRLSYLGGALYLRFKHIGELSDLEEAIMLLRCAVDLTFNGHPESLGTLGVSLLARFERLGRLGDLEEAILRLQDAVVFTPDAHPHKPICLNNLVAALHARFRRFGNPDDLRDAISRQRDVIGYSPDSHVRKPGYLTNLGGLLYVRFLRLGSLKDLDEAISRFQDAVGLTPQAHLNKPLRLNNLASSFFARFQHLEEHGDLDKAILTFKVAIELVHNDYPDRRCILHNLGLALKFRFESFGELSDIELAISILRDTVYLTPEGHPDKHICLHNLADSLRLRFTHLGRLIDIEQAISTLQDAMDLIADDNPSKFRYLNNLGNCLLARFRHLGELHDLEHTISRYTDTIELTPNDHPFKPLLLSNLGSALLYRFEHLGELRDLKRAMLPYSHAACAPVGRPTARFHASQQWILCARILRHPSLLGAYSCAIGLLPQLAWIGYSWIDRYNQLRQGIDVVREAAAAALDAGQPEMAVEWLEQGRSIVWGELFQLRGSYEELSSTYPDHAHKLQELSTSLEHTSIAREKTLFLLGEQSQILDYRATAPLEQQAGRHRTLAIERETLLGEIRRLPGFERFLLHKEFSQLCASAQHGPVVILNAAKNRCDALIVLAEVDHVIHAPLPDFTLERCKGLQNMMKYLVGSARVAPGDNREGKRTTRAHCFSWENMLSTLWNGVVKPVLDALNFSGVRDLSRIFWCPTGPFAFLPIHTAGLYGTESSSPGQKLSDFVVSSYVPTLSILTLPGIPDPVPREDLCLLAVRQPSSDGQSPLPGVDAEMKHIRAVVQGSPLARTTFIESSAGTVEEVLTLMKKADWVHFACHGIQDMTMPIDSGLCLADRRRLKLSDIISISRPRGGLAFLSACQTATGDRDHSDEAIHIAAGMLFAGYGGVIGTMWSISDRVAPLVARDIYTQLFQDGTRPDYRDAARALHDAVERLRESNASFVEWIPFIHVGL